MSKEKIYIAGLAYRDGGCEMDCVKRANNGRESFAGPLQDSLIYRADREGVVRGLYISYKISHFDIGDFMQQP